MSPLALGVLSTQPPLLRFAATSTTRLQACRVHASRRSAWSARPQQGSQPCKEGSVSVKADLGGTAGPPGQPKHTAAGEPGGDGKVPTGPWVLLPAEWIKWLMLGAGSILVSTVWASWAISSQLTSVKEELSTAKEDRKSMKSDTKTEFRTVKSEIATVNRRLDNLFVYIGVGCGLGVLGVGVGAIAVVLGSKR